MTICTSTPLATAMLPTAAKTVALLAAREITTGKSKSGAGDLAEDPPHTGTAGEITDHCAVACAAELAHRRQVKASPPALADDSQDSAPPLVQGTQQAHEGAGAADNAQRRPS